MHFSLVRWFRGYQPGRKKIDRVLAQAAQRESDERLLSAALRAVNTVYPDTALNPGTTQWPEMCVPGDPCGPRWSNDADRAEWHDCANHQPRGRHRIRPAIYAVVTDAGRRDA